MSDSDLLLSCRHSLLIERGRGCLTKGEEDRVSSGEGVLDEC